MPVNFRDLSAHPTVNFNMSDFLSACEEPLTAAQLNATNSVPAESVLQDSQDSHGFCLSVVTCQHLNGHVLLYRTSYESRAFPSDWIHSVFLRLSLTSSRTPEVIPVFSWPVSVHTRV